MSKSIQVFLATAELFPRGLIKARPAYEKNHSLKEGEVEKRPFTATEILYHMVDVEVLWQYRMNGLLSGTFRHFQQMNPDKEALEKRYNARNYERGLRELAMARAETTRLVSSMTTDQLLLSGLHSKYGAMDMIKIMETMESHDRQHAAQLDRTLEAVSE